MCTKNVYHPNMVELFLCLKNILNFICNKKGLYFLSSRQCLQFFFSMIFSFNTKLLISNFFLFVFGMLDFRFIFLIWMYWICHKNYPLCQIVFDFINYLSGFQKYSSLSLYLYCDLNIFLFSYYRTLYKHETMLIRKSTIEYWAFSWNYILCLSPSVL